MRFFRLRAAVIWLLSAGGPLSTRPDHSACPSGRTRLSVEALLAAKNTQPIRSLDDLAADTFESDEELEEFLAFNHAERQRDLL